MKKFTPRLVKLSDEAVAGIPSVLRDNLPAENMAYAIRPEECGIVLISDSPDPIGHICTSVKAEHVENLPKITAKSAKCMLNVSIKAEDTLEHGMVSITIPDGITDGELLALVESAAKNLKKYRAASETTFETNAEALAAYLTEFGPGPAEVVTGDLIVNLVLE